MKCLALPVAFAIAYLVSNVEGLSCLPCNLVNCTNTECNFSGRTPSVCGCCRVCAKAFGETCEGLQNTEGGCDKNLTCVSGTCSDSDCLAIVDVVFALDGSETSNYPGMVIYVQELISRLYDMYGACANVEVMQYAGSGSDKIQVYPVPMGFCTNNDDCIDRNLRFSTKLGLPLKETYAALYSILEERFPFSTRDFKSKKVIIVLSPGGTADVEASKGWVETSTATGITTYAIQLGANTDELLNITGSMERIFDTFAIDDLLNKVWTDTTQVEIETCSQQCTSIGDNGIVRNVYAVWMCHFENFKCRTYQWRLSLANWWYSLW